MKTNELGVDIYKIYYFFELFIDTPFQHPVLVRMYLSIDVLISLFGVIHTRL